MKPKQYISLSVFFAGFVFLVFGIFRGEVDVILQKAVHVCLECIGIG